MSDPDRISELERQNASLAAQVEELTKMLHEALARPQQVYVFPPLPVQIGPQPFVPQPYKWPDVLGNGTLGAAPVGLHSGKTLEIRYESSNVSAFTGN